MNDDRSDFVSAQVVLNSAGISTAADVIADFARAGFRTGPLVANNFSITAPQTDFERFFRVGLEYGPRGEVSVVESSHTSDRGLQLPVDALPPEIRPKVQLILFSELPPFGPTGIFA